LLRGRAGAVGFIKTLASKPSLSVVTVAELIAGVRNPGERLQIETLVQSCSVHDVQRDIAVIAGEYVAKFGPSHSVDVLDAMIAATAMLRGLPLATLNLKHFPMFPGLRPAY
jgi:predicted nucleic acid-binding protein